jgi:hypothetical protein
MAGAVLENFDYQVDVTVWIALQHVLDGDANHVIVEPDSEEDVALDKSTAGARLTSTTWQVQVKRRNSAWLPSDLANESLLRKGKGGGRPRALDWLADNPAGRYSFVTNAGLAKGIHGLRTEEVLGDRVESWMPKWAGNAAQDARLSDAAIVGRIGVRSNLEPKALKRQIQGRLWERGVSANKSKACMNELREGVWSRLNGTETDRRWTRSQIHDVIWSHGGLRKPFTKFVRPACYDDALEMLGKGKCVVVGGSGFGKSWLVEALVLHHRNQDLPFDIVIANATLEPQSVREVLSASGRRTLYVIDNAWGAQVRHDDKAWKHRNELDDLLERATVGADADVRFLLTTRPEIAPYDFRASKRKGALGAADVVILDDSSYPPKTRSRIVLAFDEGRLVNEMAAQRIAKEKGRPIDIQSAVRAVLEGESLSDAIRRGPVAETTRAVEAWVDAGDETQRGRTVAAFWLAIVRQGRWSHESLEWLDTQLVEPVDAEEFVDWLVKSGRGEWRNGALELHAQRIAGIAGCLHSASFRWAATPIVLDDFNTLGDDALATLAFNAMALPDPIRAWLDRKTRRSFRSSDLLSLEFEHDADLARFGRWYGHFDVERPIERLLGWSGRDINVRESGFLRWSFGSGWGSGWALPDWHDEIEDDDPQIHTLALAFVQRFAADQPGGLDADVVEWLARISPPVRQYLSNRLPEALESLRHEHGLAMYAGGAIASGQSPATLLVSLLNALDDRLKDLPRIRRKSDEGSSLRNADDYFQAMAGDATVEVEAALKVVVREIVHQGDQATIFQHARVADLLGPLAEVIDLEDKAAMSLLLASAARNRPAALDRMMQRIAYTASRRPVRAVASAVAMLEPTERIVLIARIRHQAAPGEVNSLKDVSTPAELDAALALNGHSDAQLSAEVGELLRKVALVAAPTVAARAAGLAWAGHAVPQHILDRLIEDEDALAIVLEGAQVPDELIRTSLSHARADVRAAAVGAAARSKTIEAAEWEGLFGDPAQAVRAACLEAAAKTRLVDASVARLVEDEYVDDSYRERAYWSSPIARRAVEVLKVHGVSEEAQRVLSSALKAERIRDSVVVDGIKALIGSK